MNIKNVVESASYIEIVNMLDSLVFELLYSKEGYLTLTLKTALDEAQNVIAKYDYESSKIIKDNDFKNIDDVVKDKRQELIEKIQEHYSKEAMNWAFSVYQNMVDNCIFCASINKDDKKLVDKFYNRALSAISWICEVKEFDEIDKNAILDEINLQFQEALQGDDSQYLPKSKLLNSDEILFMQLRSLITQDLERFLRADFNNFSNELTKEDISYFQKTKNELQTNKRTSVVDDIILENTAIEILGLENDKSKYAFLKQVRDDFLNNKDLNEDNKISIVKRRIKLFSDTQNKNMLSKYYKNLLTA